MNAPVNADDWHPTFVLPNVDLETAIERDPYALAPRHDPRVLALCDHHPLFNEFLDRFTDPFERELAPLTLLVRMRAPEQYRTLSALGGFRDAIALSIMCPARAYVLQHGRSSFAPLWGDAFAFYPWMLDREYEFLLGSTLAQAAVDDVEDFRGQCNPGIHRMAVGEGAIDRPLLDALLEVWDRCFQSGDEQWADTKVLRSLNMAYHASLMPTPIVAGNYDVGRLIALWVSAFEILAHPGGKGSANRSTVAELFDRVHWLRPGCAAQTYACGTTSKSKNGTSVVGNLAQWLLMHLYRARNDFLHGNPVDNTSLALPDAGRPIFEHAAPLYRLALTGFLELQFPKTELETDDPKQFGEAMARRSAFKHGQRAYEDALLTARTPRERRSVRRSRSA